ncbi:SDR family NAD(P)-dependent oxidoreductase, partial [Parabacteroides distasonis]
MGSLKSYIKRGVSYILYGQPSVTVKAEIFTSQPAQSLKGKKILITGGNGGLGKAMAKKFIAEGAEVIITGRNEEKTKAAAAEVGCQYLIADLQN